MIRETWAAPRIVVAERFSLPTIFDYPETQEWLVAGSPACPKGDGRTCCAVRATSTAAAENGRIADGPTSAGRLSPSDVLQEAFVDLAKQMPSYAEAGVSGWSLCTLQSLLAMGISSPHSTETLGEFPTNSPDSPPIRRIWGKSENSPIRALVPPEKRTSLYRADSHLVNRLNNEVFHAGFP